MQETYQVPPPERRDLLLASLGHLCERQGYATLVRAPTLEPTNRYFPDRWTPTVGGVRRLIQRLMAYAGLGELRLELEVVDESATDADDDGAASEQGETAVWHVRTGDGVCRFGLDRRCSADPVELTAMLCREVTRAYRQHHALGATTRETEEQLIDLTTIFLGFGLFTVSTAFFWRSRGVPGNPAGRVVKHDDSVFSWRSLGGYAGGFNYVESAIGTNGSLPAGELAFLLAARAVARGDDKKTVTRLRRRLPANQAHAFKASYDLLVRDAPALRLELGVVEPELWPPEPDQAVSHLLVAAEPGDERALRSEDDLGAPEDRSARAERRRPTFRVRRTRAFLYALLGAGAGVGIATVAALGSVLPLGALGLLLGAIFGRLTRADFCANPECGARLKSEDTRCPSCHRRVAGEIHDESQRLAAEEAWDEEQAQRVHRPYRDEARPAGADP